MDLKAIKDSHDDGFSPKEIADMYGYPHEDVVKAMQRIRHEKKNSLNAFVIYNRDGLRCQYCGTPATETELTLDHILPHARGGQDTAENLVTACQSCNSSKGARPLSEESEALIRDTVERRNLEQDISPTRIIRMTQGGR